MGRKKLGIIFILIGIGIPLISLFFISNLTRIKYNGFIGSLNILELIISEGEYIDFTKIIPVKPHELDFKKIRKQFGKTEWSPSILSDSMLLRIIYSEHYADSSYKAYLSFLEKKYPLEADTIKYTEKRGRIAIPYNIILALGSILVLTGAGLILIPRNNS